MANTTPLTYRIDTEIKNNAEAIITNLGMTPTVAIQMFYKQVIINNGLPFDAKLNRYPVPVAIGALSEKELKDEIMKGYNSAKNDLSYSPDDVDAILASEFGI